MMSFFGTIKTAGVFQVKGKDGSLKPLVSMRVVDALGNTFDCQMWPDDAGQAQLVQSMPQIHPRQLVQFEVAGYAVRPRKFKDGTEQLQLNLIITNVGFPNPQSAVVASVMTFHGTMKGGKAFPIKGGASTLLSFTTVDELGNTWPCQMWSDDPQQAVLVPVIDSARRQPVQFEIASYAVRPRKFADGTEKPQVNFVVSRVSIPGLNIQAA